MAISLYLSELQHKQIDGRQTNQIDKQFSAILETLKNGIEVN